MSNELDILKKDMTIVTQEKEILELKLKLEKVQVEKSSRLGDSLFSPALYDHYQNVAKMLSKTTIIPTAYRDKPEDIFVAMAMGYQLGFPVEQSLQDIAVINGRPCLWGDGLLSLCLNHKECESIVEVPIYNGDKIIGYSCTVKRRGHDAHTKSFTSEDAQIAGLLKKQGPWTSYPSRMLQMRARSYALRDKFADALRGLRIGEIEQDDHRVIEGEVTQIEETQTQRLKKALKKEIDPQTPVEVIETEHQADNVPVAPFSFEELKERLQDSVTKIELLDNVALIRDCNIEGEEREELLKIYKEKQAALNSAVQHENESRN